MKKWWWIKNGFNGIIQTAKLNDAADDDASKHLPLTHTNTSLPIWIEIHNAHTHTHTPMN